MQVYVSTQNRIAALLIPLLVLTTLSACTTTSKPSNLHTLAALAELFEGQFDTHANPDSTQPLEELRFMDSRQRVVAPALGEYVYYLQLNRGNELKLYRQRLLVLDIDPVSGHIVQRSFTLHNPDKFTNARTGDQILSGVNTEDIKPMFEAGCEKSWTQTSEGFYGYVDPGTCRIFSKRRNKYRRIESETWLTNSTLALAERGFDDQMNQEFGTAPGEATLLFRLEGTSK